MSTLCRCGRPTGGNTYLCGDCRDAYARALGDTPAIAHELNVTLARQARFAASPTVRFTSNALPYDVPASDALHRLHAELVSLVLLCEAEDVTGGGDGPALGDTYGSISRWLLTRLDGAAARPWAADLMQLVAVIESCELIIDRPEEKTYAGPCEECTTDLYVQHGLGSVQCEGCGKTYDVQQRRDWLLDVVYDRLASTVEIARALSSLELPITADLISQWRHRKRLLPKGYDKRGAPLYRVGDVIELMTADRTRRQGA